MAVLVLGAGLLGGFWWIVRGGRRARRLYRRWRWRNSIVVYGFGEPGRAWQLDAALAAGLALAGPLLSDDLDPGRCWRGVWLFVLIYLAGGAPFHGSWR